MTPKVFGLSSGQDGAAIYRNGKACKTSRFGGRNNWSCFGHGEFEMPVTRLRRNGTRYTKEEFKGRV